MHINSILSGQGAPSTWLIVMAGMNQIEQYRGDLPIVIVADTGNEKKMLCSDGKYYDNDEYFYEITQPLAEEFGMEAVFVRARDGQGEELPSLRELNSRILPNGKTTINTPMFGSNGGRLQRTCTSKYKISATRQELRRRGAETATSAIGFTVSEAHRMKPNEVKWEQKIYPLIDARLYRAEINEYLDEMGVPYLISTECGDCPFKDFARWKRTHPDEIKRAAQFERDVGKGEFFLTRELVPLEQAINLMKSRESKPMFDDMPCGVQCGV